MIYCATCDCWVPRRVGDWEVHLAGIRHRRQALSLREHGQRGQLVVSVFEGLPGPSDSTHALVGKAAADFGLGPQLHHQQQSRELERVAEALQKEASIMLVGMLGSRNCE